MSAAIWWVEGVREIGIAASTEKLPAQKKAGRYETGFVEGTPSRVFRDGEGNLPCRV
jgi:hypothetical protein